MSESPPIQMRVLVLLVEVRGFEGSKAERLGAMLWRVPGREFGAAILESQFEICCFDVSLYSFSLPEVLTTIEY